MASGPWSWEAKKNQQKDLTRRHRDTEEAKARKAKAREAKEVKERAIRDSVTE
jgi:hypothetical protein